MVKAFVVGYVQLQSLRHRLVKHYAMDAHLAAQLLQFLAIIAFSVVCQPSSRSRKNILVAKIIMW
jgi:hypothetical protein